MNSSPNIEFELTRLSNGENRSLSTRETLTAMSHIITIYDQCTYYLEEAIHFPGVAAPWSREISSSFLRSGYLFPLS